MPFFLSLVVLVACVKLLLMDVSVRDVTIIFAVGKVLIAFAHGGGLVTALIVAVIVSAVSFGYFWLLDRLSGSGLWWLVLVGGAVLLV